MGYKPLIFKVSMPVEQCFMLSDCSFRVFDCSIKTLSGVQFLKWHKEYTYYIEDSKFKHSL